MICPCTPWPTCGQSQRCDLPQRQSVVGITCSWCSTTQLAPRVAHRIRWKTRLPLHLSTPMSAPLASATVQSAASISSGEAPSTANQKSAPIRAGRRRRSPRTQRSRRSGRPTPMDSDHRWLGGTLTNCRPHNPGHHAVGGPQSIHACHLRGGTRGLMGPARNCRTFGMDHHSCVGSECYHSGRVHGGWKGAALGGYGHRCHGKHGLDYSAYATSAKCYDVTRRKVEGVAMALLAQATHLGVERVAGTIRPADVRSHTWP
jgi:hypothetical protein